MSDAQVQPQLLVTTMSAIAKTKPTLLATTMSAIGKTKPILLVSATPIETTPVSLSYDTSRSVNCTETISTDTSREITNSVVSVTISADTSRNVHKGVTVNTDTSRNVVNGVTIYADTSREVNKTVTIESDTSRETTNSVFTVTISADTSRKTCVDTSITADTKRRTTKTDRISVDTSREVALFAQLSLSTKRIVFNNIIVPTGIGTNVLTLKPIRLLDDATNFDSIANFDFNGGISTHGTYQIPAEHRIYNESGNLSYVNIDITAEAYNINQTIDLAASFDAIEDFDGSNIGAKVKVVPYLRLSDDGSNYGNWQTALSGTQYKAKYYDFKIELRTADPNITVVVKKFGYSVYR